MKRRLLLAFIICSAHLPAYNQTHKIDSLQHLLQIVTSDTSKVLILSELSGRYLASQPEKAKQLAIEAMELGKSIQFLRGEIIAVNHLADYHFRQSNYAEAIESATRALRIATEMNDSLAIVNAYRLLGNTNTFGLKQFDQALSYHKKALALLERLDDEVLLAAEYGSITWIYAITNQNLEEAHDQAKKGLAIARKYKNYQIMSYNYNSTGMLYFSEDKYDSALVNLQRSIDIAALARDNAVISYNKSIIGNIYLEQKNYRKAIEYFNQSMVESKVINLREVLKDSYYGLSVGYGAQNQFDRAYKYHKLYTGLKDSLLNWETTQKTLMIERGYEQDRQENKIRQLETDNNLAANEKQIYLLAFTGGFVTLIAILFLIVRNNRQRQTANQLLKEKNDEIAQQNEELIQRQEEIAAQRDLVAQQNSSLQNANDTKDKLFSIIGHDLRGPLGNLRALLGLASKDAISQEELRMLTPKINQSLGTVHEMMENLLEWSYTQMNGMKSDPKQIVLHPLAEKTLDMFRETAVGKNIGLDNHVPQGISILADENHVRLILRNLVANAIKFTPEGGKVTVGALAHEPYVLVRVSDTGVGISSDRLGSLFDVKSHESTKGTAGEKGTGLGLLLCKEMVEINGGKIEVRSTEGSGSIFEIYFKPA